MLTTSRGVLLKKLGCAFLALVLAIAAPADAAFAGGFSLGLGGVGYGSPSSAPSVTAYPGQAGNLVGYANTLANIKVGGIQYSNPAYSGSLTASPGGTGNQTVADGTYATSGAGTALSPYVFEFYDFAAGSGTTTITLAYATFIGCRFQSNSSTNGFNVYLDGASNIVFSYSTVVPPVSVVTAPPNAAWPSAGAGLGITSGSGSYSSYTIPNADGYEYGIHDFAAAGPVTVDSCDIWGGATPIDFPTGTSFQITLNNNWFHDPRNNGGADHTDGPGYLNAGAAPTNVAITNNAIAGLANGDNIAAQGATTAFNLWTVSGNYLSGFEVLMFLSTATGAGIFTNSAVTNNVIGTDLPWADVITYANYTTVFSGNGNSWSGNKLNILSGTSQYAGSAPNWTSANQGYFVLPSGLLSATDF